MISCDARDGRKYTASDVYDQDEVMADATSDSRRRGFPSNSSFGINHWH